MNVVLYCLFIYFLVCRWIIVHFQIDWVLASTRTSLSLDLRTEIETYTIVFLVKTYLVDSSSESGYYNLFSHGMRC